MDEAARAARLGEDEVFHDHKEEKKTLAPQIAERTGSTLVAQVGNVAVFLHCPKAE